MTALTLESNKVYLLWNDRVLDLTTDLTSDELKDVVNRVLDVLTPKAVSPRLNVGVPLPTEPVPVVDTKTVTNMFIDNLTSPKPQG